MKIERAQVELDKPIKALGEHKIKIHLHPEVVVEISVLVARSADEAEFLAKGGRLVAETERAQMEAAEAAQRAADQAAALFEAKAAASAEAEATEGYGRGSSGRPEVTRVPTGTAYLFERMPSHRDGMRFLLVHP